ncbi:TraG family protein [human gut metagenome]|uniref:TraG family protein n=1 Tax=human gut metagenome TaxID=408170 RepID=K1TSJ0_9ZZZZ
MMLFGELERRDPQHPAVLQFKSFMLGAKKTLQSILISAAANLYMFNSRKFAEMTSRDEMFLPRMGLEQRALFIVLPDNDTTFNSSQRCFTRSFST